MSQQLGEVSHSRLGYCDTIKATRWQNQQGNETAKGEDAHCTDDQRYEALPVGILYVHYSRARHADVSSQNVCGRRDRRRLDQIERMEAPYLKAKFNGMFRFFFRIYRSLVCCDRVIFSISLSTGSV